MVFAYFSSPWASYMSVQSKLHDLITLIHICENTNYEAPFRIIFMYFCQHYNINPKSRLDHRPHETLTGMKKIHHNNKIQSVTTPYKKPYSPRRTRIQDQYGKGIIHSHISSF
jgi:hypothetical protein